MDPKKQPVETEDVRLDDMVCFNLHAAARAVTAVYRPLLKPLGVTYPQYLVLATLWEDGDLTVRALTERLQMDYGTMTPLLKRMEQLGFLSRTRNPQDERSVIVALAPHGEDLRKHAPGIYATISDTFGFSEKRAQDALAVLRSIVERADAADDAAP